MQGHASDLVAMDIGGTHARFALARFTADGGIELDEPVTLKTSDYVSLQTAWEEFERRVEGPVPRRASLALAAPIQGETVRLTNNSWVIHIGALDTQLGLEKVTVLNDFAAVAHAVARAPEDQFLHLTGPDKPLPENGTVSVIGPGTGLGVAQFYRVDGTYHVQASEGGHANFAPVDHIEDELMKRLRHLHRRVSVERVVSGPGIVGIYETLASLEHRSVEKLDDRTIWERGLDRSDMLAVNAIERFCMALGSASGDFALTHGASAVVMAGGLGYRIRHVLHYAGFGERFRFKGRYEPLMASIPVKFITHPQPGLFGAAAAFQREHLSEKA
ncbi:glucokinase [Altericroceibacterium spongiae]|uniref:Glucokinase n=1 Tax=Altericroceibacterium spongiae TaxID=2320269 RepID=A0A420EK75_9SPHN|nr:glucokinase [Altericroceibacterium spongiae]RKF21050.1 glucokinase [Altericroceibacterium spongiae]